MLQSYPAYATKMLQRNEEIVTPPRSQSVRPTDALKIVEKIVVGYQTGDKMNDEDNKLKYEKMRKRETRNEKTRNPSRVSRQSREDIQR